MKKNVFDTMKVVEDSELHLVTGGKGWGWLAWVEPVGEFFKGFTKGVQKEGDRNKWKNI
ncbi:lactococcin G-beta family bacteriocin [Enterococcus casseliflavus]|uniref:lactococcin G-beta family bacteriocin n=1 Tax=Enterococcus casseliflavus TaxID=37734 RepID=UPI0035D5F17F